MEKRHINTILESLRWTIYKFENYIFIPFGNIGSDNFNQECYQANERIKKERINDILEAKKAFENLTNNKK